MEKNCLIHSVTLIWSLLGQSYLLFFCVLCVLVCLVTQSCPALWDPMDCSPPGSSVSEESPDKNTGVGCHALLQVILPTQGSNPGLPHCRWILELWYHFHLSESPGKLKNTGVAAYPFSKGTSPPRDWTRVSCIAGRFFTSWATQEAHSFVEDRTFFLEVTDSTRLW